MRKQKPSTPKVSFCWEHRGMCPATPTHGPSASPDMQGPLVEPRWTPTLMRKAERKTQPSGGEGPPPRCPGCPALPPPLAWTGPRAPCWPPCSLCVVDPKLSSRCTERDFPDSLDRQGACNSILFLTPWSHGRSHGFSICQWRSAQLQAGLRTRAHQQPGKELGPPRWVRGCPRQCSLCPPAAWKDAHPSSSSD